MAGLQLPDTRLERDWPCAVHLDGPPPDDTITSLQKGKMRWNYDWAYDVDIEWLEFKENIDETDIYRKIKVVLEPYLNELQLSTDLDISLGRQCAWTRVYSITDARDASCKYEFCLSPPIYPWYRTEAEVATIQFVRQHTTIPTPTLYVYDSSPDNILGYEWILMERLPGVPFSSVRDRYSLEELESLASAVAEWIDQLSRQRFNEIGSLYLDHHEKTIKIGRPVIESFMTDWRHEYCFRRGPFKNICDFLLSCVGSERAEIDDPRQRLRAEITFKDEHIWTLRNQQQKAMEQSKVGMGDRDLLNSEEASALLPSVDAVKEFGVRLKELELEYSKLLEQPEIQASTVDFETRRYNPTYRHERAFHLARLGDLVDKCCSKDPLSPASAALQHWDVSEYNVMVDPESKTVTGLVDWQQVCTVPLPLIGNRYPPIMGRDYNFDDRSEPPEPSEGSIADEDPEKTFEELFWENQMMRRAFDERLKEMNSSWLHVGQDSGDEAGGKGRRLGLGWCRSCLDYHPVQKADVVRELSGLIMFPPPHYCRRMLSLLEGLLDEDDGDDSERHYNTDSTGLDSTDSTELSDF